MTNFGMPRGENFLYDQKNLRTDWIGFFSTVFRKLIAAGNVAAVSSPNATDLATAITLVNELKTQVNALNTALKSR